MHTGLLAVNLAVPIAIGAGVLALAAFLYGIFRKFTRVSWLSWQTLLVFAPFLRGHGAASPLPRLCLPAQAPSS